MATGQTVPPPVTRVTLDDVPRVLHRMGTGHSGGKPVVYCEAKETRAKMSVNSMLAIEEEDIDANMGCA